MEIEGATKYGDEYIPRQVWDERVLMQLLHVQYLMQETKSNDLENINSAEFCYWKYWTIKIFICHMR